jgi:hypothetical protein
MARKPLKSKGRSSKKRNRTPKKDDGRKQWKKKLECFFCGDEHYASNCPKKRNSQSQEGNEEDGDDAYVHAA